MRCYPHFILPMRRSRGFASTAADLCAFFRLAFASAPPQNGLTLPTTVSRRIIMQKARRHTALASMVLRPLVSVWFQVHYPPLVGVLPIFRSRYWFAIGRQGVLSLAGWAPQIRADFHVCGPTQVPARDLFPTRTGLSPSTAEHSRTLPLEKGLVTFKCRSYNPPRTSPGGLG